MSGELRSATVRADTNAELWRLDRRSFRYVLANHTALAAINHTDIFKNVSLFEGLSGKYCVVYIFYRN